MTKETKRWWFWLVLLGAFNIAATFGATTLVHRHHPYAACTWKQHFGRRP